MKDYPRIKRLSTLGIVHHQHFDYEFNAFRTDFVGEGGAGKSMISDLLQLICVGTKAFHSPTKSTGPRRASTMVLKTEGRGTDLGYAFISIEKIPNEYLVIGIYLESNGASQMFIVQNGNDFGADDKLQPFSRLLGVADFLRDGEKLPIADLKVHLQDTFALTCESWEKTPPYHKLLFNNNILPLDLSLSHKALDNYAKIIQAFSREALDMSKSRSLQSFIFGDEREKQLSELFYLTVEELSQDTKQFEDNLDEIEQLNRKQEVLADLLALKQKRDDEKDKYLVLKFRYQSALYDQNKQSLIERVKAYLTSLKVLPLMGIEVDNKIINLQRELDDQQEEWENRVLIKREWDQKSVRRNKLSGWISQMGVSKDVVVERHRIYWESREKIERINLLKEKLGEKGLLQSFDANEFGERNILAQIETQIGQFKTDLEFKKKLKTLNDVEDEKSLANWALNTAGALTSIQEAIVRKFQNGGIKMEEPSDQSKRYAPDPEQLLSNLSSYKDEENGFWLSLDGVVEFFSTDFEPIFNSNDIAKVREYFQLQVQGIAKDIEVLDQNIKNREKLYRVFDELEKPEEYLKVWKSQVGLDEQLVQHELYELTREELESYIAPYEDEGFIAAYEGIKEDYRLQDIYRSNQHTLLQNLKKAVENFVEVVQDDRLNDIAEKYVKHFPDNFDLSELLDAEEKYLEVFERLYAEQRNAFWDSVAILRDDLLLEGLKSEKNNTYKDNPDLLKDLDWRKADVVTEQEVRSAGEVYVEQENNFRISYEVIIGNYLGNNAERFKGTDDFMGLCRAILPAEIFQGIELLEKDIIEKINKYLRNINQQNKKLNGRKLQKLSNLVEEAAQVVSEQLNDVREIQRFLNSDGKEITGGNKVSLDYDLDHDFSLDWMGVFTQAIADDLALGRDDSLFEEQKGLSKDLEKYPALKEKLLQAFYRSGGSRNIKPTIEELLNPKSYYSLRFSIKNSTGKKNDGSTSQAYAAITLLCIARLSLLNKIKQSKPIEAIRFMAIDEAEGLGSNFDMLYRIAKANDYQILSLSISPNKIDAATQNIYMLHNSRENPDVNYDPVPIFGSLSL